jgi:hydrogenase maturation protease
MSGTDGQLVAIGVGNLLLGDDGAGIHVLDELRSLQARDPRALPPGVRLVDGGTLGLALLDEIRDARGGLVLVDAVRLGGPSGTVHVLHGDAIERAVTTGGDEPATAVAELLAVTRLMGWLPSSVTIVGIEVRDLEPGLRLSPAVDAALADAVGAACAALWSHAGLAGATR